MTKAHLADSMEPLREGSDLTANCGAVVPKAQFVFLWDNENYPEFLSVSMTRICQRCAGSDLDRKYIYGIVPAQEVLHETHELSAVA